jgi:hypothetical protein
MAFITCASGFTVVLSDRWRSRVLRRLRLSWLLLLSLRLLHKTLAYWHRVRWQCIWVRRWLSSARPSPHWIAGASSRRRCSCSGSLDGSSGRGRRKAPVHIWRWF